MFKSFIRLSLILLVVNLLIPCEGLKGFGRGSYGGKYGSRQGYKEQQSKTYAGTSPGFAGQSATRRGLGLSAWGIVTVVVSFILAIVGLYYFSMCYPVICQKNKKYDMIGLTSVA